MLHDISHVPLSHDLEKKTHKVFYPSQDRPLAVRSWYGHYDKHDDYEDNPLLYRLLCDYDTSVLARVLRYYSKRFWKLLQEDADKTRHQHLKEFVDLVRQHQQPDWKPELELLPQLLFHLLFLEKPDEAEKPPRRIVTSFDNQNREAWHLGPKTLTPEVAKQWHDAWYQPFRHDIIGNTLSADLIDDAPATRSGWARSAASIFTC